MTTSIFVKTWSGDLPWLPYCLKSIKMYGSEFDKVIVVSDISCYRSVKDICTDETIHTVPDWNNGYVQQQWVKLNADAYTQAEQILFVDSDCVFHTPFTPDSFIREGKPILMKTKYGDLGGAEAWREITSNYLGFSVHYEYMRRLPWMYLAESLKRFRTYYPMTETYLRSLAGRDFSEFNALGAFIEHYEPDDYYITDTKDWIPDAVAEQFWSWGGFTPEILSRISQYLKMEVPNVI
jgi:hypothetical protein